MSNRTNNCIVQSLKRLLPGVILCCSLFALSATVIEDVHAIDLSPSEAFLQGERIYRDGVLPSGEPMQAVIRGDVDVPGTSFSCVSCHLRSGLGSIEGGVVTPPTNGRTLFQPYKVQYKQVKVDQKFYPAILQRPTYTDASLATALREGITPSGQVMNPVMPRYYLDDKEMALLIAYLKTLSDQPAPGVTETEIKFATVITDDVPSAQAEAMLAPLEEYVRHKNSMINLFKKEKRSARMAATMVTSGELMYKKLTLSRWMLKGPPETWRSQLEEYYRQEPVFALLGGISNSDWKPIHDFSEANHLPCLFPQTDYPVISTTDWYTLYHSKGIYQEGEAAARFLNEKIAALQGRNVLQIVRNSRQGQALSTGFQETWRDLGFAAPVTVTLGEKEVLSKEQLQKLLYANLPAAILVWDGAESLAVLESLVTSSERPAITIVSASYLGDKIWSIPEQERDFTFMTYPYRLPQREESFKRFIEPFMKKANSSAATEVISKKSYIATQMLTQGLMDLRGNYYRDNLFDVIGMMRDQELPLYTRLSFGPGQRYASKGCYMVQLDKGAKPALINKSDWVIH
ncbi:MAG: ABC transporter substrate-binding protein [Geobacteraceae bacterium]|nr:ABC transporter substrate-binding protein [Geobacteraceae bacterium]